MGAKLATSVDAVANRMRTVQTIVIPRRVVPSSVRLIGTTILKRSRLTQSCRGTLGVCTVGSSVVVLCACVQYSTVQL
jgi:hypothetical protein